MMSSTKKVSVWMCSCSEVGLRLVSDGAAPGQHRQAEPVPAVRGSVSELLSTGSCSD